MKSHCHNQYDQVAMVVKHFSKSQPKLSIKIHRNQNGMLHSAFGVCCSSFYVFFMSIKYNKQVGDDKQSHQQAHQ